MPIPAFSATEKSLALSDRYFPHIRVQVLRTSTGVWEVLNSLLGEEWVFSVEVSGGVEKRTLKADVRVVKNIGAASLEPLNETSFLNVVGGQFDPLLALGAQFKVDCSVTAVHADPGTWRNIFHGIIDDLDTNADSIVISGRDLGGLLLDASIRDLVRYAAPPGVFPTQEALESVLQNMLDDWAPGVTLRVVGGPTGQMVSPFDASPGSLMDAMVRVSNNYGGWDFRYLPDPADNVWKPTLYLPDREKTTPDYTISDDHYWINPVLNLSKRAIYTRVRAYYVGGYMEAVASAPVLAQYGDRFLSLTEYEADVLPDAATALETVTAALADVSQPPVEQHIRLLPLPMIQVGDLIRFLANGREYTSDHDWAVVSFRTIIGATEHVTEITTRGKPAGAYRNWVARQAGAVSFGVETSGDQPEKTNLFALHPTYNPTTVFPSATGYSVPLSFYARMLKEGDQVSASTMIQPTDASDQWRMSLWFTDANGGHILTFTGGLVTGNTISPSYSEIEGAYVPVGAAFVHVGAVPVGTPVGTATHERDAFYKGAHAGAYIEPPDVTQQVELAMTGFRALGEVEDPSRPVLGILHRWNPVGPSVVAIHVFEGASWPAPGQPPDVVLPPSATEHRVSWPAPGTKKYVTYRTVGEGGSTGFVWTDEITADPLPPPAGTSTSSAYIELTLGATNIDVKLTVTAGAFPIDVVIKEGTTEGSATTIATHTFAAAGSIDKNSHAGLGARPKTPYPFGWWVTLTDNNGEITKFLHPTPVISSNQLGTGVVQGGHIVTGAISAFHIQAGSITATQIAANSITADRIDVADLISAGNLVAQNGTFTGNVTIGKVGTQQNYLQVNDPSSGAVSISSYAGINTGDSLAIGAYISMYKHTGTNERYISISGHHIDIGNVDNLVTQWGAVSPGAADSGGAGYRQLLVPN